MLGDELVLRFIHQFHDLRATLGQRPIDQVPLAVMHRGVPEGEVRILHLMQWGLLNGVYLERASLLVGVPPRGHNRVLVILRQRVLVMALQFLDV